MVILNKQFLKEFKFAVIYINKHESPNKMVSNIFFW